MKFYVPIDLLKSQDDRDEMRIRGIASTPDLDRDNESVVQEGLDISDFVDYGFFNLDHDNGIILGYPDKEKTKITKDGLYVEGTLLDTPRARDIWDTAMALQKSNAPRRLGFSIEGRVVNRDNKGKILKAKVTNVAITSTPVNPNATWDAVVKSMASSSLSTDTANSLVPESLEGIKTFVGKVEEKDEDAIQTLEGLQHKLNNSTDIEDIRAYLMIVKGLYGKELDYKLNDVLAEMSKGGNDGES